MVKRQIYKIVIHCTDTSSYVSPHIISRNWRIYNKWSSSGYHYMITADGVICPTLPLDLISNGVAGHNKHSIHIAYIGRVPKHSQLLSISNLILELRNEFHIQFPVYGHRELAKGKTCPNFDVKTELGHYLQFVR